MAHTTARGRTDCRPMKIISIVIAETLNMQQHPLSLHRVTTTFAEFAFGNASNLIGLHCPYPSSTVGFVQTGSRADRALAGQPVPVSLLTEAE